MTMFSQSWSKVAEKVDWEKFGVDLL